jgi:ABC-type sulfate transport system substrate-binding protein
MQSTHVIRRSVLLALLGTLAGGRAAAATDVTLLNVSYDPTRELYREMNRAFIATWQMTTGQRAVITNRMAAPVPRRVPCWMGCRQM